MLTPAEAEALIAQHVPSLPVASLPVGHCAGAILREDVCAERDLPPFDRVAMDGIALSSAVFASGRRQFAILGTQAAGDPPRSLPSSDGCLEVMTGAVLPPGTDAVVPVERLRVVDGIATLDEGLAVERWQSVHRRGSDQPQGALLLRSGQRLGAAEVAVAAGAGKATLQVSRQPSIRVISTGNELVDPGLPIQDWQLRRSNAYGVMAALRQHGFHDVGDDHLPDEATRLQERIAMHLAQHDVLILSGGVSMGKFDLVPAALAACGVRQVFHKLAQRPGKPLWFGVSPRGTVVFGLPGNPVSTLVCLRRYVLPALALAQGSTEAARGPARIALGAPVTFNVGLTGFLPVCLETGDDGMTRAVVRSHNGSGDDAALVGTDGFIELPPGPAVYPKGHVAPLYRW